MLIPCVNVFAKKVGGLCIWDAGRQFSIWLTTELWREGEPRLRVGIIKGNMCNSELWLVSSDTEMELFCVWCQVSATYLHRREIQRVHNNWWWMLSFEPFAHFCCAGKITILKYASATPKVGSILLRCDVGGWEDVSSFATLLFKLETLIWSGRGVSLHPFKNFTFI